MTINKTEKFQKIFNKFTSSKKINEGILLVENTSGEFSFMKGYGKKELSSPFLMASITKLLTTTCILILLEQDKLSLEDRIVKFLDVNILKGVHVYKGREYSYELTVSDLLFQTSGLPDVYLEGKNSLINRIIQEDFHIHFNDTMNRVKKLKPHFEPRKKGKAYYADINFDILGQIVEKESGLTLCQAYEKYIFEPLGLVSTYLPEDRYDEIPKVYYMNQVIHRPKFVISSGASGGCITTAQELMIFIKAFFGGELFNKSIFRRLSTYNKLQASMGPIHYGGGYMQIPLSGLISLYMGKGELVGHSGSTGSFAFYYPIKDLFFVGDLNQMATASLPIKLSIQLAMAANRIF
ncbi:serine hydrolase domain-containing protein [Amphibacillus cookii]|uniref:serine hydrolase domain-containing protein n=1 Tax=Amphibacillus cookii TaxID=767787 RepID=UPI0019594F27|nr:serine hydrolase domain-containing protein [Amphibacillus cookii]MBM7540749.1 CubicO group peptidase (beta-lactamase class C family) [Amphibacillus cookii]